MARYYLAGPMSGYPQFNFPLFDRVAKALRASGLDIVSPAELDSDVVREEALATGDGTGVVEAQLSGGFTTGGETWGDLLARDVKLVADEVDGLVVLPGWSKSRGACLEVYVAGLCRKPVYALDVERMDKAGTVILTPVAGSGMGRLLGEMIQSQYRKEVA